MERRKFVVGLGAMASGGAAALGTGAFSRVESHRSVTVEVANDENAYVGYKLLDTPNSDNYVDYDEDGHIYIDIGENPNDGDGVNSDSYTWFDGLFELCNQGKADADFSYELPEDVRDNDVDDQTIAFYYIDDGGERQIVEEEEEVELPVGECEEIGLRTVTKGIDATDDTPLIDGDVTITAVSDEAGEPMEEEE